MRRNTRYIGHITGCIKIQKCNRTLELCSTLNILGASHIDFVHEKPRMDVGGGGGGVPVTFLGRNSLLKIFNILKPSIQSMQNPVFS